LQGFAVKEWEKKPRKTLHGCKKTKKDQTNKSEPRESFHRGGSVFEDRKLKSRSRGILDPWHWSGDICLSVGIVANELRQGGRKSFQRALQSTQRYNLVSVEGGGTREKKYAMLTHSKGKDPKKKVPGHTQFSEQGF